MGRERNHPNLPRRCCSAWGQDDFLAQQLSLPCQGTGVPWFLQAAAYKPHCCWCARRAREPLGCTCTALGCTPRVTGVREGQISPLSVYGGGHPPSPSMQPLSPDGETQNHKLGRSNLLPGTSCGSLMKPGM